MAQHRIDDQQAFQILRATSNGRNVKLSAVAAQIMHAHLARVPRRD